MIERTQARYLLIVAGVLCTLLVLAAVKLAHGTVDAPLVVSLEDGRSGKVRFTSYSAQWSELPTRAFRKAPVNVTGDLLLPERMQERVPAVILLHGSDGLRPHQYHAARALQDVGMAVFLIDSFTPRGIDNTINDQAAVTPYSMLVDAYQALALLQTHPKIDPQRIALVGWSKGGMVADWASRTRYRAMLSPEGHTFAAHVAFYPWCGEQQLPVQLTGAPLLYLVGARDHWTGASACRNYVQRIREAGFPVELVVYPDAEHAFDYPGQFRQYLSGAESWVRCNYVAGDATFRVIASGATLPWSDFGRYIRDCTLHGAHVGSNSYARKDAADRLRDFLLTAFAARNKP